MKKSGKKASEAAVGDFIFDPDCSIEMPQEKKRAAFRDPDF